MTSSSRSSGAPSAANGSPPVRSSVWVLWVGYHGGPFVEEMRVYTTKDRMEDDLKLLLATCRGVVFSRECELFGDGDAKLSSTLDADEDNGMNQND